MCESWEIIFSITVWYNELTININQAKTINNIFFIFFILAHLDESAVYDGSVGYSEQ